MGKKKQRSRRDQLIDDLVREAQMTPEERAASRQKREEKDRKRAEQIRKEIPLRSHIMIAMLHQGMREEALSSIARADDLPDGALKTSLLDLGNLRLDGIHRLIEEGDHTWEEDRCSVCGIARRVTTDDEPESTGP